MHRRQSSAANVFLAGEYISTQAEGLGNFDKQFSCPLQPQVDVHHAL